MKRSKLRTAKGTFSNKRQKHRPDRLPCPWLYFQGLVDGTEDQLTDDQEGEGTAAAGMGLFALTRLQPANIVGDRSFGAR